MALRTSLTLPASKLDCENCDSSWLRRVDRSDSCTLPLVLPPAAALAAVPEERAAPPAVGWVRSARVGSVVLVIFIATPATSQYTKHQIGALDTNLRSPTRPGARKSRRVSRPWARIAAQKTTSTMRPARAVP